METRKDGKVRVVLYTRLSPNPDKKDTVNQERALNEFIGRNEGWELVNTFTDINVSGTVKGKDRPKFQAMMLAASQKQFDLILFWAIDRFSREGLLPTLQYLDRLDTWGVKYKSYTEPYIDSTGPFKDIFLSIATTFAKMERARLIDRTRAGIETARLKGKKLGRPTATTKSKKRRNPVKIEEVVRLNKEGKSLREIVGVVGSSPATIMRILKREVKENENKNT